MDGTWHGGFWQQPALTGVLVALVAAHLLGDFVFQTRRGVEARYQGRRGALGRHALVHAVLAYILVGMPLLVVPVAVFISHLLIDAGKRAMQWHLVGPQAPLSRRLGLFFADQAAHLLVIFMLVWALDSWHWLWPQREHEVVSWGVALFGPGWVSAMLVVAGAVVVVRVGAVVIAMLGEPFTAQLRAHHAAHATQATGQMPASERRSGRPADEPGGQGPEAESPPRSAPSPARPSGGDPSGSGKDPAGGGGRGFEQGGQVIGQLERAIIFLLVLSGHVVGVGFLVAAKAVFRFGELKEPAQRMEAEYILIGTLMSFTWALAGSWLTVLALGW